MLSATSVSFHAYAEKGSETRSERFSILLSHFTPIFTGEVGRSGVCHVLSLSLSDTAYI